MALEQLFEEQIEETAFGERGTPLGKWKKLDDEVEENLSGGFECNICLDVVHDPVVTFCGHLYCWPCIYKWIHFQSISSENPDHQQPQCPVCKAEVSQKSLIPLYGRGHATKPSGGKDPNEGIIIPQRPPTPRCGDHMLMPSTDSHPSQQLHHQNYQQHSQTRQPYANYMAPPPMLSLDGTPANMLQPRIGDMVYAQVFGTSSSLYTHPNSYHQVGSSNLRMRRQMMHADESLGRVSFFLFCCLVICLLLF